uniref:Uncharacterized protein n=1 Tax=Rhizophora mucronata TaxID=61149 RepID=A0A2P2JEM3_RHIMU
MEEDVSAMFYKDFALIIIFNLRKGNASILTVAS